MPCLSQRPAPHRPGQPGLTQQNAALVEQAATAACSTESQANDLKASVSIFRLGASADSGTT
jgi:hypothetical protein